MFTDGKSKNKEPWRDGRGGHLVPDEHYNVGGKTKWYGTRSAGALEPGEPGAHHLRLGLRLGEHLAAEPA